jgi:hypothetical protein
MSRKGLLKQAGLTLLQRQSVREAITMFSGSSDTPTCLDESACGFTQESRDMPACRG